MPRQSKPPATDGKPSPAASRRMDGPTTVAATDPQTAVSQPAAPEPTPAQADAARYQRLFEQAPAPIAILDPCGLILEANAATAELLGRGAASLPGRSMVEWLQAEDGKRLVWHLQQIAAGASPGELMLSLRPEGKRVVEISAARVDGESAIQVVFRNAGRCKSLEESLYIRDEFFKRSLTGNVVSTPDARLVQVNQAFVTMFGYQHPDDVIGMHVAEFFQDPEFGYRCIREFDSNHAFEGEFTAKRADGSTFAVYCQSTATVDGSGNVMAVHSSIADVTPRRRIEESLRNHVALLAAAESLSKVGGWLWDVQLQAGCWTQEAARIHGMDWQRDRWGSRDDISTSLNCYDPADRPLVLAAFERCITHGEPYDLEFPFTNVNGERLWIRTTARPVWEDGRVVQVVGNIADITGQKQARDESNEATDLLARFIRESPIHSYINQVGPEGSRILYVSDSYEELFNVRAADIVGKMISEVVPPEIASKYDEDNRRVVESGEILRVEEEINGRWHATIKFPIMQGSRTLLAGYSIDITERKQHERILNEWNQALERRVAERTMELKQSESRVRQLVDAAFEGIAVSENGILVDGNLQLGVLHGCSLAEMIGRPVIDFVAPESRGLVMQRIRDGITDEYEYVALRRDGSTYPAEAHASLRVWGGRTTRVTALRDLTVLKQTTARLQAQQTALEHAQRLAMLTEVSAGVIHQIGQPLCALGANLLTMRARYENCDSKNCGSLAILDDVQEGVAGMRNVVLHLRSLAQTEQPMFGRLDLNHLIDEVMRMLRQEAENRQILLTVRHGRHLRPVAGDAVQLKQVVLNLVRNACDACGDLPPERRRVLVTTTWREGKGAELAVRDSGCGISPAAAASLFAPFFTTKPDGLGIGLRLSKTIVEAHRGTLEWHPNPDRIGVTFLVTLPEWPGPAAGNTPNGSSSP